jgi:predicted DsbA family dithiol-disulfide isomerase
MARQDPAARAWRLRVYTDYLSPACYLAEPVLARLRGEADAAIEYRAFELLPEPAPRPDFGSAAERAARDETIAPLAAELGVPIRRPALGARTRKAHEAALLARRHGVFDALHAAIFAAYFVGGRDIGRIDVLVELGAAAGLDRSELKVALDLDTYAADVAAEREEALALGLTGAPAFVRIAAGDAPGARAAPDARIGWHDFETLHDWLVASGRPGS